MDPLTLMAVGTGVQILGGWYSNMQQAQAERENQAYYLEQEKYAMESARRAERLAGFEYAYKIGNQVGAYAASGIDTGSGSAAITIGGSIANEISEVAAIRRKGEMDMRLARLRANQSGRTADTVGSAGYNLMQGLTTGLGNYAKSEGFGSWNSGRTGITDKYPGYGSGYGSAGASYTDFTDVA